VPKCYNLRYSGWVWSHCYCTSEIVFQIWGWGRGRAGHHNWGKRGRKKGSFHFPGGFKVFLTELPSVVKPQ
jgi:hypothetical protein